MDKTLVVDSVPSVQAMRRVQTAIRESLARMDRAWEMKDRDHFYGATVETAMWIAAVDEHLRSDSGYRARRDSEAGGRIVLGMHVARNAALHNLVEIHEDRGGLTFPMTFPVSFSGATWRSRSALEGAVKAQKSALNAYDECVAGNDVQQTLRKAQEFVWMRALPTGQVDEPEWLR